MKTCVNSVIVREAVRGPTGGWRYRSLESVTNSSGFPSEGVRLGRPEAGLHVWVMEWLWGPFPLRTLARGENQLKLA